MTENIKFIQLLEDTDINTLETKLDVLLRCGQTYNLKESTNNPGLLGIQLLAASIYSLSQAVLQACKTGHIYAASLLACSIVEAQIQLVWLDQHYQERGKDYVDFGYVEEICTLQVHLERKEQILKHLQEHNCDRFLRSPELNKLDRNSYHNYWYANKIKNLSNDNFNNFLTMIKDIPEIDPVYKEIDVSYENYQTLCKFKHFSPYCVGNMFIQDNTFKERNHQDYVFAALAVTYTAVTTAFMVLNRHGENILQSPVK